MVEHEQELLSAVARTAITWSIGAKRHLSLLDTVPSSLCPTLVTETRSALKSINEIRMHEDKEPIEIEIYEFCSGVNLQDLKESQVNEEKATQKRNSGPSVLLIVPPGTKFPSIASAFEEMSYREALRLAAQDLYRNSKNRDAELLRALGIESWLIGSTSLVDYTEGWAQIVAMIALGADRVAVGRELWRVGLIPDIGQKEVKGDFSTRLQRNKEIVKCLSSVASGKKIIDRLSAAKVGLTVTTRKVISILETRVLANSAGDSGWCKVLEGDDLTLDKWDLEPDTGDLEAIQILPFRDLAGKVRAGTKLKQDDPKTFSEALYSSILFNDVGDAVKPPSVVVEWVTVPSGAFTGGKWRVSLVIPKAYRRPDDEPLLSKTVRVTLRKQALKLDFSRDDLPDGFFGSNLLVAVEVAAISDDDEMVMRLKSGEEALDESEEFELRFDEAPPEDGTAEPSADSSISPAVAFLDVALEQMDEPLRAAYILRQERSLLEIQFLEPNTERAAVRAVRSVRVIPRLIELQHKLLTTHIKSTHVITTLDPNESLYLSEEFVGSKFLPEDFFIARTKYFEAVKKYSKTPNMPLVETLEWESEVCESLDNYVDIYERLLRDSSRDLACELLLLDTVQVVILGSEQPLITTVILPTHPLRSLWLRDYWNKLFGWTQQVFRLGAEEKSRAVDLELVERISPGNLPFVMKSFGEKLQVYAEEIAFGYGVYVDPEDSDHEAMVSLTIKALGSARSKAMQSGRIGALKRNVENYIMRRRHPDALAIAVLNAGDGELVSDLVSPYFVEETDQKNAESQFRLEVTAYSENHWMSRPAQKLTELQTRLSDISRAGLSHLSPLIGLAVRSRGGLTSDEFSVHLSIVQGIAIGQIESSLRADSRRAHLGGLLTGTQTLHDSDAKRWHVTPTGSDSQDSQIVNLHKLFLAIQSRLLNHEEDSIGLMIKLTPETTADIRALHNRSDRVITLDRYVGLDWFINSRALGLGNSYILDYTPDFIEGLADRVIVTTQHPAEADRVVDRAMQEMGLVLGGRRSQVIDNLNLVSGRLVLRLMTANPQAHETVGLAVVMAVLRNEDDLKKWFVIPIDSHLEIFGTQSSEASSGRRRCDMLLVAFSEGKILIRCVEVKERRSLPISEQLKYRIEEQLDATDAVLRERYFLADQDRVDRELQLAYLSSILHHYLARARENGLLSVELFESYSALADQLDQLNYLISKEAFVVSIESSPKPSDTIDDVTIRYLTSKDLESTSFSSIAEVTARTTQRSKEEFENKEKYKIENTSGPSLDKSEAASSHVESRDSQDLVDAAIDSLRPPIDDLERTVGASLESETKELAVEGFATPNPDSPVVLGAEPKLVTVELGIDSSGQPILWEVSTKGSPHAFVLGITGQGKSVTTRHVIASFVEQNLPSLVIDMHGDMAANPPSGASVLDVRTQGLGFSPFYLNGHSVADISESAFEIAEVFAYVCDLGEMQFVNVFKAIKEAYAATGWVHGEAGERLPTIEEFAEHVERVEKGAKGKNARERLLPLTDFGLFQQSSSPFNPKGSGSGLVVDLHKFKLEQVIRAATSLVLRKIYRDMFLWPQDSTLKLAVVLDEAHRMAQDPTLPKLLKEGRKYGVSCFVASQSISDFDDDVKNNAGTKIVFRTNFPESKDVAGLIRGGEKTDFAKQIEQLQVGEAFVSTADLVRARKCKMQGRGI